MTKEATPRGTVSYTYDKAGRRTGMTVAGQTKVTYTYDNADRLINITQGTAIVSMGYDNAGRRRSLKFPNTVIATYTYDKASRLTGITYKRGTTTLGTLTYQYDRSGNRIKTGGTWARTTLPQAIATAGYDAANQQLVFGGKTMTYDLNGNLSSINAPAGLTTFTWDARDQLLALTTPSLTATFKYDGLARRIQKIVQGTKTDFVYDGLSPVQEKSGTAVLANLLGGLGIDEHFTRSDSAGTRTLLTDGLGSTLALTDNAGAVKTQYTYEPFGKTTASGSANKNSFQYTGRENDDTGLYYYRARYYNPSVGRFISEDPLRFRGSDLNLYTYVLNKPAEFVDPFGSTIANSIANPGRIIRDLCLTLWLLCGQEEPRQPINLPPREPGIEDSPPGPEPNPPGAGPKPNPPSTGTPVLGGRDGKEKGVELPGVLRAKKRDVRQVKQVVRRLNLNKKQRSILHDWINKLRRQGEPIDFHQIGEWAEMVKKLYSGEGQ